MVEGLVGWVGVTDGAKGHLGEREEEGWCYALNGVSRWIKGFGSRDGWDLVDCIFGDVDEEERCHVGYHKRFYSLCRAFQST